MMNRPDAKKAKLSPSPATAPDTLANDSSLEVPSSNATEQSQQQFCVRWSSHQTNLQRAFPKLLMSESFVDVTLACEHNMIKCHKVVLSASSSYFEKLLQSTACKHPIIFLKDMKFSELKTLVDFIYRGQVNVNKDELKSLMKSAEALEIRGLNGTNRTYLDKTSERCVTPASAASETDKQQLSPKPEPQETLASGDLSSIPCEDDDDEGDDDGDGDADDNVDDQNDNRDAAVKAAAFESNEMNGLLQKQSQPHLKTAAAVHTSTMLTRSNRASSSGSETAVGTSGHDSLFGFLSNDCGTGSDTIRSNSESFDHQPDGDEGYDYEMNDAVKYSRSGGCNDGGGGGGGGGGSTGDYEDQEDAVYDDDDIEQNVLNRVTCHISEVAGGSQMEMFSPNYQPGPDFMMSMVGTRRIRRTDDELKKAAEQITKGQTFQMVSDRFNIPISTIRFYMARKGILPQRKRGRSCSATSANAMSSAYDSRRKNCSSPTDPPYHIAHYKLPMLNTNFK